MVLFFHQAFLALLLLLHPLFSFGNDDLQTYIVHVELPDDKVFPSTDELERWYHSFLANSLPGLDTKPRMVHMYKEVTKGFAARLTPDEFLAIQEYEGLLHARPQRMLPLHTTHSPGFLGLQQDFGFWKDSNFGQGVIIGVLDTGVFPDHPSFSDEGMPPPPPKWKGVCEFNFTACNNKLIGARYFNFTFGEGTPLDANGHGTHAAGIAAGNFVPGANFFGQANGTAVGIAPRAHLAIYKVCSNSNEKGCPESDILAGMDVAIQDGVDVLSLSLGLPSGPFAFDAVALGAYSAIQKGIFVSCSADNSGPAHGTLRNDAPWILTVGASSIDRKFKASVVLGNKVEVEGESLFQPMNFSHSSLSLVYLGDSCSSGPLLQADIEGKIVVCEKNDTTLAATIRNVGAARAAALILIHPKVEGVTPILLPTNLVLPIQVSFAEGSKIVSYINSTSKPVAALSFQGTVIGDKHAPIVAYFSSRFPSRQSPGILKPDIIGPGSNILAASPISNGASKLNFITRSGTSMSCPHLSGIAALIKSLHPDWSPAAIKSAIMTTADVVNLAGNPIEDETLQPADVFATGAGHVNPSRSTDPGLIYDIEPQDYIPYLCGLHYTDREVGMITQRKVNCSQIQKIPESQLNYPSFSIIFGPRVQTYTRTVINAGEANSTYVVKISAPEGVNVSVMPEKLEFTEMNQRLTYRVTFTKLASVENSDYSQGFLLWSWGKYAVRSPIVAIALLDG